MCFAIIIPALNEEKTIAKVVRTAQRYGTPVVIDDGSSDTTANVSSKAGAVVLSQSATLGYDCAIGIGMKYAEENGFSFVATMDADGEHDGNALAIFKSYLQDGASLVLGVRDHKPRIAEKIFSWWTSHRWGINDPLSGMKGYRMSLYAERGYFDRTDSIGTELMMYAVSRQHSFKQVPIKITPRADQSRFGRRMIANYRIFRAMFLSFKC
ncbi:glycosyltransferase family 2 protein [Gammaproteobacteria bacterium]|nr:glycosyltransferase family 2 protein [Gammaproteobacteria bacterium]